MRLYSDATFLERARQAPVSEFGRFPLSECELDALIEIARLSPHLDRFREGALRKAFERSWSSFHLVRDHFDAFKEGFFTAFRCTHDFAQRDAREKVNYFAEFLCVAARADGACLPDCFQEVVLYDRLCTRLAADPLSFVPTRRPDVARTGRSRNLAGSTPATSRQYGGVRRVLRTPGLALANLHYEISRLVAGDNPNQLPRGRFTYAFVPNPLTDTVRVYQLGTIMATVLEQTAEPRTVGELVRDVERQGGTPEACRSAVDQLEAAHLLVQY